MSRLKFVSKKKASRLGKLSWVLHDLDGHEIGAFSHFCRKTLSYAFATRKRYAEVVAHFIDYLIAARVLGVSATRSHLNAVLDAYPHILVSGSALKLKEILRSQSQDDAWLIPVLTTLTIPPLAPNSLDNTFAAIKKFLELSENIAVEAFEKAACIGIEHSDDYRILFDALHENKQVSGAEIRNMRSNSMLGSVLRFRPSGVERPRSFARSVIFNADEIDEKAFPFELVLCLAAAAKNYRDRAFWLLLAASGLRSSEGKALTWDHIRILTQEIFVMDPRGLRLGNDMSRQDLIRFKGRLTSFTYLIYQFRVAFFEALELYVRHEYIPPRGPGPHYVFQYLEPTRRGQPFIDVSDTALLNNFHELCTNAGIPKRRNGKMWSPHSLRHMYAIYMHNDFPLGNGEYGLSLPEVQVLIGHKSIIATAVYARKKRDQIRRKIATADEVLMADMANYPSLPLI